MSASKCDRFPRGIASVRPAQRQGWQRWVSQTRVGEGYCANCRCDCPPQYNYTLTARPPDFANSEG